MVKKPVLSTDIALEATKLCEFGPKAILNLSTSSPDEITNIEWQRFDSLGTIETLSQFKNQLEISVEKAGIYEVTVFNRNSKINKNCELGRKTIQVDLIPDKISFDIPGDLSICEPYELTPQSTGQYTFTLPYPDGKVETKPQGASFKINQEESYTILGFDSSIKGPKCPEEKIFRVKINPPVKFQPIFINLSCSGEYEYVAQVENYPANQVDYFWRDPSGNLVESGPKMISSINGTFTLEVQPKGSLPCLTSTSSFELPVPVLSVDTKIIASTLCPDQPNATLQVDTSIDQVNTIEWWFIDFNKNRNQLTSEVNKTNILVSLKGTYEVIAKNEFNCILGKNQVLVLRSTDEVQPKLKETYPVCPNYGIGCGLNPGQFSTYEWYNEGALIWTNPTFKPLQIGNYELFVESAEGCIYQTSFSTFEECELKVRLPNALQITNPDKQFLVYTNYLVDELEIWIYNKWGSLIFHCKNTDLINEESTCIWDGYYNGVPLPNGTYAYRTYFVNLEKGIRKEQFGSILVVD